MGDNILEVKWYILFSKTGHENKTLRMMTRLADLSLVKPFIPKRVVVFRRDGFEVKYKKNCFPGYIFVESSLEKEKFIMNVLPVIKVIDSAFRFINYGDKFDIALHESEKTLLEKLLGDDFCVDYSVGVIEKEKVRINEGPLKGMEGMIRKINRHKREAEIEINLMGDVRRLTIALEIVDKL